MTTNNFRGVLFVTFIAIFIATAAITLLGITNVIAIRDKVRSHEEVDLCTFSSCVVMILLHV